MPLLSTLLCSALALGPAPQEGKQATLTVDTSHVGEAGPIIRRRTEERGAIVLRDAGVLSGDDPEDPVIRVDVHEIGGEDPGFRLEVWIERKDEILVPKRTIECTLCTETEIVAKAEVEIVTLVSELPSESTSTEPAVASPPPTGDPTAPPGEDTDTTTPPPATPIDDERRPLGPKGKAGIGLLAGGAVVAGVGIGLAVPGWKPLDDDPTTERSTRPIGIGVAAAGGAALITGAVLLALDRRATSERRSASLTPTVGWRSVGLAGRF